MTLDGTITSRKCSSQHLTISMGEPTPKISCGPLLRCLFTLMIQVFWFGADIAHRYTYINHEAAIWNGSILVVVEGTEPCKLHIQPVLWNKTPQATRLLSENGHTFWRYNISIPMHDSDLKVVYGFQNASPDEKNDGNGYEFWVPSKDETMRILFHSCNGFSLGVKPGTYAGPVLWEDVLRGESQVSELVTESHLTPNNVF